MAKTPSKKKVTPKVASPVRKKPPQATDLSKKPAPNKAKPPRPAKKQDVVDIEQADAEGMAQPQGLPAKPKKRSK
jgi:hypothetical protein